MYVPKTLSDTSHHPSFTYGPVTFKDYNYNEHHSMPPSARSVELFREKLDKSFRLELGKIAYLNEGTVKEIVAAYQKSQEDAWGQWQAEGPSSPTYTYATSGESVSSRPATSFNEGVNEEVNEDVQNMWDGTADWNFIGSWPGLH
jgi:hypothetical protein